LSMSSKDFNAEALINVNYHLGYQRYVLDSNLIIGGRFKYIAGAANAHFSKFDANISTSSFEWTASTDIVFETSGYDLIQDFSSSNPLDFLKGGNPGWGLDLGATYLHKKMAFSAAVLNMGSITFKQNNKIYASKGSFVWEGIEVDGNGEYNEYII